jgi:hypothetical protein
VRRSFERVPLWLQFLIVFGLCELDRGWPTDRAVRRRRDVPLVPHPPTRGPNECFPALRQSLVGAWQEGAYGVFTVWLLIDSMILPQVHLRNGESTAVCVTHPVTGRARLYLRLFVYRKTHRHVVCEQHPLAPIVSRTKP